MGCIWPFIWMLLTFQFFLNIVLFPQLPLNIVFSVAWYVHISLHLPHSACFSHLNDQKDNTPLSLYLLTTIIILFPSYLNLKVTSLNSFIIWVFTGLQTAFGCRSKHLRIKLLKYNSQNCSQFLSLHKIVFDISQGHPKVTGFFPQKDNIF